MKPKILVSCGKLNFPDDIADMIKPLAEIVYVTGEYSNELKDASGIIAGIEPINQAFLEKAPKLGIVSRHGVGYDSVDFETCTKRGIFVTHTPDVLSDAVADLTWALILGWYRKIPQADKYTREDWGKKQKGFPFGWDMPAKTLGLLGLGRIGAEVVKRGVGFRVKMIYHDVVRRQDFEEKYGITYVSFEELLKTSDIVSIHVPLIPLTQGMIGREQFLKMKKTALIVNTSRGPVINQKELTEALEQKLIAGAALDVYEVEPIPLGEKLLRLDNILVTPHIASATWETRHRMGERCAESVKAYLEGKRPPFVIPEQRNFKL